MNFKPLRDPIIVGFYLIILLLYVFAFAVSLAAVISYNYQSFSEGFLDYLVVGASPFIGYLLINNVINIKYEIINSEKVLSIRSGFIKDRIKLKEIRQVEVVNTWLPHGTMARKKVKVYLQRPGMQTSYFHVGVKNQSEFIESLKKYVDDLIVISPEMRAQMKQKEKNKNNQNKK